jgi:hypothetical protein
VIEYPIKRGSSTDIAPDYKTLSQMPNLTAADRKLVQRQLQGLPPRIKEAQEKEMGEMMGKLKQVWSSHDGIEFLT